MKKDRAWLKTLRESRAMTQTEAAKAFGISSSTHACLESGRRHKEMSIETARKIAEIFKVPFEYVLENETKIS